MKNTYLLLVITVVLGACSSRSADDVATNDSDAKKARLEAAKKEMASLKQEITALEKELAGDPESGIHNNAVLVSPYALALKPFEHYIEVRGTVESRKNVLLSSQTGGKIEQINVREGQRVARGQVLVMLDADVIQNSITELESQLELAKVTFEKQEKLWSQKIGTEMQYLQAKNQKESLESRLGATKAQLDQLIIRAPFEGIVDRVEARVGENAGPGTPLVRVISHEDTYLRIDVSENFIGRFSPGEKVGVYFPAQDKKLDSKIKSVGQVINPENRTFDLEVALPSSMKAKPNQVAVVTIRDYVNPQAYVVPTKLIQRDNQGQFVYRIEQQDGKNIARKAYVQPGISYDGNTEIVDGLTGIDTIAGEGFRDLADGVEINLHTEATKAEVANNK